MSPLRRFVWTGLKIVQWIQKKMKLEHESSFVYNYILGAVAADSEKDKQVYHKKDGRIQWIEIFVKGENRLGTRSIYYPSTY